MHMDQRIKGYHAFLRIQSYSLCQQWLPEEINQDDRVSLFQVYLDCQESIDNLHNQKYNLHVSKEAPGN